MDRFCQRHGNEQYRDFLNGMVEYTTFAQETLLTDRLFCPLVVFFESSFYEGPTGQHPVAWDALNWIHERDPAFWPENVALDPEEKASPLAT